MTTDLLVVGGGPAGAATAAHLARAGREVLLLEAARHPRPKACAEYASPAIADELRRLGLEPAAWQAAAIPLDGMRVIRGGDAFDLRYADRDGGVRPAWGVDRLRFDALLADHAVACGARLVDGTRLVGASRTAHGWEVVVRGREGERRFAARWLIGADGARSRVAHLVRAERPVAFPRRLGLVAHYADAPGPTSSGEMHVGPGSAYVGLAPTPDGRLNVAMALPLDRAGGARGRYDAAIAALPAVAERLRGARRVSPIRGAAPIGHRVASAAGERWLLVGDAAGFLDPFTGEGIYRALRSARAAAAALLAAAGPDEAAAGYLRLRRGAFAAKDALTWIVQGMLVAPPVLGYAARRLATRPEPLRVLGGALGDTRAAHDALDPRVILSALRP